MTRLLQLKWHRLEDVGMNGKQSTPSLEVVIAGWLVATAAHPHYPDGH